MKSEKCFPGKSNIVKKRRNLVIKWTSPCAHFLCSSNLILEVLHRRLELFFILLRKWSHKKDLQKLRQTPPKYLCTPAVIKTSSHNFLWFFIILFTFALIYKMMLWFWIKNRKVQFKFSNFLSYKFHNTSKRLILRIYKVWYLKVSINRWVTLEFW